jgi:hypothetical protein
MIIKKYTLIRSDKGFVEISEKKFNREKRKAK